MRSGMCEWYDVKVRDILASAQRDVREIEILGGSLRWTEEGLEYEASDKHRQGQWSEEMPEGTEKTRFRTLAATSNYTSLDRSDRAVCRERDVHEAGEPDTRRLE